MRTRVGRAAIAVIAAMLLCTSFQRAASAQRVNWSQRTIDGRSVGEILVDGRAVLRLRTQAAGLTPLARARIVASRLERVAAGEIPAESVRPALVGGYYVIAARDQVLVTVDEELAALNNSSPRALAYLWANSLRSAFGAPPLTQMPLQPAGEGLVAKVFSGIASWYGPGFHGKSTASGEIFDQYSLTAAHRTLPFGTRVRVTNQATGKSVLVTINDRGPWVEGRDIDLSQQAARVIGVLEAGVALVKLEILR